MILDLDETESAALLRALEGYLPGLAEQASRTERGRDAHELWEEYRHLEAVQSRLRLGAHVVAPSTPAP